MAAVSLREIASPFAWSVHVVGVIGPSWKRAAFAKIREPMDTRMTDGLCYHNTLNQMSMTSASKFGNIAAMKALINALRSVSLPCLLTLLGILLLVPGESLMAATTGKKALSLKLSANRKLAHVAVPEGIATVTIQKFEQDKGWQKFTARKAIVGKMKFKLPANEASTRWRAFGVPVNGPRDKFPTAFYSGRNKFSPVKSPSEMTPTWLWTQTFDFSKISTMEAINPPPALPTVVETPVEADIWKIEGNKVYFFNQLRGLQVLNLEDPADPRLIASLRIPALGQDLYVLPGTAEAKLLVLLTRSETGTTTRINVVKTLENNAEILFTRDVAGTLADSRMLGNRLILANHGRNLSKSIPSGEPATETMVSEWLIREDQAPALISENFIVGENPILSAGSDWLAVAVDALATNEASDISVFSLADGSVQRMGAPVQTSGRILGKFGMRWRNNVLTAISEVARTQEDAEPVTLLENFRVWAPGVIRPMVYEPQPIGSVSMGHGENLYATRFAGDKAYIVTFFETDPLWIVDLSDPKDPKIAGHLEVPGWSTHLEPMGDLLLSVGWESGTVAASLFDVADPAAPTLLRRLNLGASSEAVWDEKALKVLPDLGLAMIPMMSYDPETWTERRYIQLLDVDTTARDLVKRGSISHDFDARRADLLGDHVVSISQRVMVTAEVTDRDAPQITSEVALAWPVNQVLAAGEFLLQIEDGAAYRTEATLRVSPATETEQILAEIPLGAGQVRVAEVRSGKLYVLREGTYSNGFIPMLRIYPGSFERPLSLDIYDASALPALPLLGSCTVNPGQGNQLKLERFLWPHPERPAVVLNFSGPFYGIWPYPIIGIPLVNITDTPGRTQAANQLSVEPGMPRILEDRNTAPKLLLFDVSAPDAPTAASPLTVGDPGESLDGACSAADGLVVLGISRKVAAKTPDSSEFVDEFPSVRVIQIQADGTTTQRPIIDLPGTLFAIGELDAKGFLAYTKALGGDPATHVRHVSACDGFDAFLINQLEVPTGSPVYASGRRLFVATEQGLERHQLASDGEWIASPIQEIGWKPDRLHGVGGGIAGVAERAIFWSDAQGNTLESWKLPAGRPSVGRMLRLASGDILLPTGEYGVERLTR